jgi:hypothetical protein
MLFGRIICAVDWHRFELVEHPEWSLGERVNPFAF